VGDSQLAYAELGKLLAHPRGYIFSCSITEKILSQIISYQMSGERGTNWSVTLNMKNVSRATCEGMINQAKLSNWGVQGQIEEGKEGTPHYQLLVKTPQVRFSAVKKMFPTGHIEKARNVKALEAYVHKDEGRLEEMKTIERKFVSFPEVRNKFFQWVIQEGHQHTGCYEKKLSLWDEFIGLSIEERIECDVVGVNPQYRSIIQRYWNSFVAVAWEDALIKDRQEYGEELCRQNERRQTDRQTVEIPVSPHDITNGRGEQEQNEEEHTEEDWEESGSEEDDNDTGSIGDGSESDSTVYIE